ncbi:MAG: phosphatase PAP2 family protein [Spirochaetia bacterium]|nr:phosphatase PAP2 family protein [Spirochaetia bacterium]
MKSRIITIFFILIFSGYKSVYSEQITYDKPGLYDKISLGAGVAVLAGLHFFRNYIGPENPRIVNPTSVDVGARESFYWGSSYNKAAITSDILALTLVSSAFWAPALGSASYYSNFHLMSESIVYTGLLAQLVKFTAGRQRPYSYYQTRETNGDVDANYSFFSGHTSIAFAAATTGSFILSEKYKKYSIPIFTAAYLLASITGYLRIASDSHYLTDVLTGAVIGIGSGLLTYHLRRQWVNQTSFSDKSVHLSKSVSF